VERLYGDSTVGHAPRSGPEIKVGKSNANWCAGSDVGQSSEL